MQLSAAAEMQVLASTQDSHKSANVHAYAHMRDGLLAAYILQHTNGIRSGIQAQGIQTHGHIRVHIHAHTHTYTHMYTYVHIYMHIHIY